MNETAAIVGIYGAVDEAVKGGRQREAVARLLPQYGDRGFSWYDEFKRWIASKHEVAGPREAFPELEPALKILGEQTPVCRMRARRLFAIAVAARAFPEMMDAETDLGKLAVAALESEGIASRPDKGRELLDLLGEETMLSGSPGGVRPDLAQWWDRIIETASTHSLIADETGLRPRPCSGKLVPVPGHGTAVAFVTETLTSEVDFDDAVRFLSPAVWKKCMPDFWCVMKELGNPPRHKDALLYHEVVSSNCQDRATAAFNAEAELEFTFWTLPETSSPEVAVTNYQLAEGRPRAGDAILVDEGSLVVAKTGGGQRPLLITTTKRIEWDWPFSSQVLEMIMCALGYADVTGNLLCCAATTAATAKKGKMIGADFPGVSPQPPSPGAGTGARARTAAAGQRHATRASGATGEAPGAVADLAEATAKVWAQMLTQSARAIERGVADLGSPGAGPPSATAGETGRSTETGSRIGDALNSYNARVASVIERWSDHTAKFAGKLGDGALDAPAMTSELVSCATLATRSWLELWEEAMKAGTGFGSSQDPGETVTSKVFHAPAGAALKLAGPLQKGAGLGELAVGKVDLQPAHLAAGKTEFTLSVDPYGCRGATYVGTVEATTADGVVVPIVVWITVP
jgi:hypothetical protein